MVERPKSMERWRRPASAREQSCSSVRSDSVVGIPAPFRGEGKRGLAAQRMLQDGHR